ncbi:MAG: DMT family transporter [Chitinophagaceae bacterium]
MGKYKGILFMLAAAGCFSLMAAFAKTLRTSFTAGQLVFYRNSIGLLFLSFSLLKNKPHQRGGQFLWLAFRGIMGTIAVYALLFSIVHMPLGTAMAYNLTSAIFISFFGHMFFKEYHGWPVIAGLIIGFLGMILVYKPQMNIAWYYHVAGLISGMASASAYITIGRLTTYYDSRIVVLSFLTTGILLPLFSMFVHAISGWRADELFILDWKLPTSSEWIWVILFGFFALLGQYFVTRSYGSDKAGIVSVIAYANIPFSLFLGVFLGDALPSIITTLGIILIIISGIIIAFYKQSNAVSEN